MTASPSPPSTSSSPHRFKGVRRRSWGSWVSEIRLPHSRERVWLGSFSTALEAACAFDAATLLLRGGSSPLRQPLKRRRSRRGLNLPHLQLAPFLDFATLSKLDSSSCDRRVLKDFIRAVACSTVAAVSLLSPPPESSSLAAVSESQLDSLPSNHPTLALESCDLCCDSPLESSSSDDSSPPTPSEDWACLVSHHHVDDPELCPMSGKEQMAMDAIFFDEDLTALGELEGYLATEPLFLPI